MEKLKELIRPSDASQEWGHSHGWAKDLTSVISPEYVSKSDDYDNYKGYKFFTEQLTTGILLISMVLSDKPFIVGNIKVSMTGIKALQLFGLDLAYTVDLSQLHDNFKGKGLGYLMYEYVIKKYGVLMSDEILYSGAYKLWIDTLPKHLAGPVFAVNSESISSIQLVSNISPENRISRFVAFSSRKKVDDKIFKACDYIKKNTNEFTDVSWLVGKKGKTEVLKGIRNENYTQLFNYSLSKDTFWNTDKVIVVGKNYCILVYKDNNKIKVIDF